mgnify:CR=1 FL=1
MSEIDGLRAWNTERALRAEVPTTPRRGFGRDALWHRGAMVAFRMGETIVIKCGPATSQWLSRGVAKPFVNGRNSVVKAWAAFPLNCVEIWREAIEAAMV